MQEESWSLWTLPLTPPTCGAWGSGAFTRPDRNWTEECDGLLVAGPVLASLTLPAQFSEDQSLRPAQTLSLQG